MQGVVVRDIDCSANRLYLQGYDGLDVRMTVTETSCRRPQKSDWISPEVCDP